MARDCCDTACAAPGTNSRYRKVLWIALIVNALMFVVELASGVRADSVSLLADAVDFMGDAANYGVSLFVLGLASVWRSRAALVKGTTMGAYGLFILGHAAVQAWHGTLPEVVTMGTIGSLALLVNLGVAALLYSYRAGDANMRSVWLRTRNDAIGNLAVMLAALGVLGFGSGWPDLLVAAVMGTLAITAAMAVIRQSARELRRAALVRLTSGP